MSKNNITLDRKILSELSIEIDSMVSILKEQIFHAVVETVR